MAETDKKNQPLEGVDLEIKEIEEEIANTKYNKHTQFHIGKLKAKLASLKEKQEKSKSGGAHGYGYGLKKTGDATILMVGFPSVGKSTLLNALTKATSKVGAYDFTTIDVVPGTLEYNGAHIQVLDLPGLIEGASSGAGRGKEVLAVARNADLVLLVATAQKAEKEVEIIKNELYNANFRLDLKPPDIKINKKSIGGLSVSVPTKAKKINSRLVQEILREFGTHNADVIVREDVDIDRFIDGVKGNRVYVPSLVIVNKIDFVGPERQVELQKTFSGSALVSAHLGNGIENLKSVIWNRLGLIRIYLKRIGKDPDMEEPLILSKSSTVADVARKIHRNWEGGLKYARIWGASAKFEGQSLGADHKLKDKDIVELHL
ncbi:MAG: GTP-binding protein [Candidatus Aenigmarchaeota archaeon]|nr:GTP-binding protein [Candidatus Aenigmarchaeota archaeon]